MSTTYKQQILGKERAIALAETKWWESKTHREIVKFQLFTEELCLPFDVFHESLEKALGRPVWTHELALSFDRLVMEFLGEADAPTMEEIINLIPPEKRLIVATEPESDEGEEWKQN